MLFLPSLGVNTPIQINVVLPKRRHSDFRFQGRYGAQYKLSGEYLSCYIPTCYHIENGAYDGFVVVLGVSHDAESKRHDQYQ